LVLSRANELVVIGTSDAMADSTAMRFPHARMKLPVILL
jgi:hypothetical protein